MTKNDFIREHANIKMFTKSTIQILD